MKRHNAVHPSSGSTAGPQSRYRAIQPHQRVPQKPRRPDVMEYLGNSLVQHGPASNRVYLMKLDRADLPDIVDNMVALGRKHGYSKLFAKVSDDTEQAFSRRGFVREARSPLLVRGQNAGCFMGKYLSPERGVADDRATLSRTLALALSAAKVAETASEKPTPPKVHKLTPEHAHELAALYEKVFSSYPFPIFDPAYLREAMEETTVFFGIREGDRLVAAASSEMDMHWRCAEMTDFATLPEFRGRGAAATLLASMEKTVSRLGILAAYTIARGVSPGMNIVFARAGYRYDGTLTNNTQIAGGLESMNVWSKPLPAGQGLRSAIRNQG